MCRPACAEMVQRGTDKQRGGGSARRLLSPARRSAGRGLHEVRAEATTQTIFAIAIVLFQLQQGLRVGRVSRGDSRFLPCAHGGVGFGAELFEPFERPFGAFVIMVRAGIGKEGRDDRIDEEQVDRGARKTSRPPFFVRPAPFFRCRRRCAVFFFLSGVGIDGIGVF